MADAIRRAHARIPCERPVEIFQGSARPLGTGLALNISLSGALIALNQELKIGVPYRLRIEGPDDPLTLPCRVVRIGSIAAKPPAARRYGLSFNLTSEQERRLSRLVDLLRRKPATDEESRFDRSLRSYWSS